MSYDEFYGLYLVVKKETRLSEHELSYALGYDSYDGLNMALRQGKEKGKCPRSLYRAFCLLSNLYKMSISVPEIKLDFSLKFKVCIDGFFLSDVEAKNYEHALRICESTYTNNWIKVTDLTITKL